MSLEKLPATMRALVWKGAAAVELSEVPVPDAGPGQALVKMYYAGICSTDTEIITNHIAVSHPPQILGHEIFGRIAQIGPGSVTAFEVGQRVVIDTVVPCNSCAFCLSGKPEFCAVYREIGINMAGGWADYVLAPLTSLHHVPDAISDEEAALIEPLVCPFGAVDTANIRLGDTVLILGTGPAGLIYTQLARLRGAALVACTGRMPERAELAREFGADIVVADTEIDELLQLPLIRQFQGFDVIIDAVGSSETIKQAIQMAHAGSKIVWYGLKSATVNDFPAHEVIFKNLTILGKTNTPGVWDRAINLIASGRLVLRPLLQDIRTLEEIPALLGKEENNSGPLPIKRLIKFN
jgi:2-desacetyl-2-hydroxyethyl bacteriochlorophyllide A dehydrogenase